MEKDIYDLLYVIATDLSVIRCTLSDVLYHQKKECTYCCDDYYHCAYRYSCEFRDRCKLDSRIYESESK